MVQKTIDATATSVTFGGRTSATVAGLTSYLDGLILTIGNNSPDYAPQSHTDSWSNMHSIIPYTAADATPSVAGGNMMILTNGGGVNITMFDGGVAGQELTLIFTDSNTTIKDGTDLKTAGDFTGSAGDSMKLIFDGTKWYEISRSTN
jgi:prepilin-type processing-associated H-X9-DG protein